MLTPCFVVSQIECRPAHADGRECRYQIAWSINPHMRVGAGEFSRAVTQHGALLAALRASGADVVELPFVHGAYDSVFAKDPALLIERRGTRYALLASQRHAERRKEQLARARTYASLGLQVIPPPSCTWEGGDVVVWPGGEGLFLGTGPRSHPSAARWLERTLDLPVIPLELRDPCFFHLDMALALLPDGTALMCEEALSPASVRRLESSPGVTEVARVARADALSFGLNMTLVGDHAILGARAPAIEAILKAHALSPLIVPLDEFQISGGSAACLVSQMHRDPRESAAARGRWAVA
jgi:N-dimethylarginine dimethylaminohydrolase